MKNDIEHKLRRKLANNSIDNESDVVYLLVQCRKLLEHDPALKHTLPTLEFYCNWGLHIQLSRASTQRFLTAVNPVLTINGAFNHQEYEACNALLTLDAFRSELGSLLASFGADRTICTDEGLWISFLHFYSHVVQDSKLVLEKTASGSGPLGLAVKKVTIIPISRIAMEREVASVFPMVWQIEYADGRVGQLELSNLGLAGATVQVFGPTPESVSVVQKSQD
jgi:hypothetical protein